jgi:hypothetical protein
VTYQFAADGLADACGSVSLCLAMQEVVELQNLSGVNDNKLQFAVRCVPGAVLRVQTSTDLLSWEGIGTVTNLSGTLLFSIPISGEAHRFYRAIFD